MGDVIIPRHNRKVKDLCKKLQIEYPLKEESLQAAFIRFTNGRVDATLVMCEESRPIRLFFQEKVPKDKRHTATRESYITITPALRAELIAYAADLVRMLPEVRRYRFPSALEEATLAEVFWKE